MKLEQVAALFIFFISIFFPSIIKPYIDTFAFGTSYARVYGFAVFLVACVFYQDTLNFLKRKFSKIKINLIPENKLPESLDSKYFEIGLILLFLYSFLGQIFFVFSIGNITELNNKYIVFDQRGYTSTHILHIHVGKLLFCPFVPTDDIDCARPIANYMPPHYPIIGFLLFIFSSLAAIAYYPKINSLQIKIAYLILSFASIRLAIDGGILNYDNIVFFMLLMLLHTKKWENTILAYLIWIPLTYVNYGEFLLPKLIIPFALFFYPILIFSLNPKIFFPILILSVISPAYLIGGFAVVENRWTEEVCKKPLEEQNTLVIAKLYTNCTLTKEFECGTVRANENTAFYNGKASSNYELLFSKAFAEKCKKGIFVIKERISSINIVDNN